MLMTFSGENTTQHVPVMQQEILHYLRPVPGGFYIDGTLGGGGHTESLLQLSSPDGRVLGIDTDAEAIARVRRRLAAYTENDRLLTMQGNFADLQSIIAQAGFPKVQGMVLDLGFSSDQMDNPQRGFSFSADGPLDMRLDRSQSVSAADLVNTLDEQELASILWRYGEERRSRQIAHRIVQARAKHTIERTTQLATIAAAGVPFKAGSIHPATRTFQALRIAVNKELESLELVLPQIVDALAVEDEHHPAGRMAIISFHSLEDRIVKDFIRQEATDCICPPGLPVCVCGHKARLRPVTRKPVIPMDDEIRHNPRARSAKLRVAERIQSEGEKS
jgi:16S rRNA (cytosine1402-N4)-methyltransferase